MYDRNLVLVVADIDAAQEHVHLLFYIWLTDNNGRKIVAALRRAAARGVRCRALVDGLGQPGPGMWKIEKPVATMFVWAEIPEPFREMGSLEFSKVLLKEGKVAVSAGIGFGETGEGYVRFALVENKHRIRQAVRGIRRFLRDAGVSQA